MFWMDSHAHLASEAVFDQRDLVIDRAQRAGIKEIVNITTDPTELERGLELSKHHPWIVTTGATTPHDVEKEGEASFGAFEKAAIEGSLAAIGETGLDYHYEHSPKKLQQEFLIRYFDLAKRTKLPLVIHCREAFNDLFSLADLHYNGLPLILHCFTGTLDEAKGVVKRGWMLSLSGIVTFKKSEELREVAKWVPLDALLIETDTPYLAPQSKRGQHNEPSFLPEVGKVIAAEKGIAVEEIARVTRENGRKIFGITCCS